jgi:hypothetical protein
MAWQWGFLDKKYVKYFFGGFEGDIIVEQINHSINPDGKLGEKNDR